MSRHNRKVPTSFFYRFTRDVCAFADKWAQGRIVSVLEGGYSDKALLSGVMAHLVGLVDGRNAGSGKEHDRSRETWWSLENVQMVRILREAWGEPWKLIHSENSWKSWPLRNVAAHDLRLVRQTRNPRHGSNARRLYLPCSILAARNHPQVATLSSRLVP